MSDPFGLSRFVAVQADVIGAALTELAAGRKQSHWMWFIFPQLADLGRSPRAKYYGIGSLAEARAFLAHPVLGPRLRAATAAATGAPADSVRTLLGSPDDLKFRSSMTLFEAVDPDGPWAGALERFVLEPDPATLALIKAKSPKDGAVSLRPLTRGS